MWWRLTPVYPASVLGQTALCSRLTAVTVTKHATTDNAYGERVLRLMDTPMEGLDVWHLQIKLIAWGYRVRTGTELVLQICPCESRASSTVRRVTP